MKLREIFRFELGYQSRRAWTWIYFVALFALTLQITVEGMTGGARSGGYFLNAPFVIAEMTLLTSGMALLVTAALAGDAAARDVQVRMDPLVYTSPVSKGAYLGGRFLAAFVLNAVILLGPQVALLVAPAMPGLPPEIVGPFRPGGHLAAYALFALPNAFIATAVLFSMAALSRRAIAGYLGAVLIFFTTLFAWLFVASKLDNWTLAKLIDPLALTVFGEISRTTTAAQKNDLSLTLVESLLWNRAVWIGIGVAALAFTRFRFRFEHPATRVWWRRAASASDAGISGPDEADAILERGRPIVVPKVQRTFGYATGVRQTLSIAAHSFREIAKSWGGVVLAVLALILAVTGPHLMAHLGVPLIPTTPQMTAFVGNTGELLWTIVPLLTVFYVGELVWREREIGLSEIGDATPVPAWVRFLGRFAGLVLVFVAYQTLLLVACVLIQAQLGYYDFELGLYLRVLFGLQLPEHVLFAVLAFAVHVLVNQKYVGHMIVLIAYGFTIFAAALGVEHKLLVYGSDPGWMYSDLRHFGPSIAPWLSFKLYWGAWAVLLAVVAKLFWVRGREGGLSPRLRSARRRLTRPTLGVAVTAAALVLTLGGFVFYNTNVLNAYDTAKDRMDRRVQYERRFGRFEGIPQPSLTGTTLRVEIYPQRREVEIRGRYRLVNTSGVAVDSIHVAPDWEVETGPVTIDRPGTWVVDDKTLGHRIYALGTPLLPGDSLRLDFTMRFAPRGFTNGGVDPSIARNGTFFEGNDWLPGIGYQSDREIAGAGERRALGLPPRPAIRRLEDVDARPDRTGTELIAFEAVMGTDEGQIAVAPGALRRSWTENGRRYFHYVTDAPIRNDVAFFSAAYAVHDAQWRNPNDSTQVVAIQILHHPSHTANLDRMVRSIQACLDYFTKHFGPYPQGQVRLVEHPGNGNGLHAFPINISYEEEFSLFKPEGDSRGIDFPFAVVAHEMAHQWWGNMVMPANVEGAALLSESLAWYSAMSVVQATYGDDHLRRLLGMFRESYQTPRPSAAVPLLRSYDRFQAYRKGPFAMSALREYVGAERVNVALRRMVERYGDATPPLPTSLDLYRELQAVTPDSLRYLLVDLFETNTYWELKTKRVTSEETDSGTWQVTLDVNARKLVVDTLGAQKDELMNDLLEVGVYGAAKDGGLGEPLHLQMHRVRSGEQRITVTVRGKPDRAGIDPRNLLIDVKPDDNVQAVSSGEELRGVRSNR
jgi:ABC-2 type transport system permease protein